MITRYFIDLEFIEDPWHLELISIALVADDGRELYLVSSEFNEARCSPWVREHVLTKLPPASARVSLAEIERQLHAFITGEPEFWEDFGAYDWVLFCWALGGRMIDLPAGWPMGVMDLRQALIERGLSRGILPPMEGAAHDALHDARHLRDCGIATLRHEDRRPVDP